MSPQPSYYPAANTTATNNNAIRHSNNHGTSSAFSSSANPDEDWTKISDLAERRRIQNRIAQRNYRKKLKRRLEDLERRAGSSSASPPQSHSELKQSSNSPPSYSQTSTPEDSSSIDSMSKRVSPIMMNSHYTPPLQSDDDLLFSSSFPSRENSRTPPLFGYQSYSAPEDIVYPPYQQYAPVTMSDTSKAFPEYLAPVPVSLPSMMHFDGVKRENDSFSPYTSYALMAGIDIPNSHAFEPAPPNTPPLSHSFENSAACSEAGWTYPSTPMSMPPSPPNMPSM